MKQKKLLVLALLALGLVISCSKDDGPSTPVTPAPTITGLSKTSGPVGTVFDINGTNFSTTASKNTVKIGTVTATVSAATATKITTSVPQGATTNKVSVTVGGKTATSTGNFTVTQSQTGNTNPTIGTTELSADEDLQGGGEVGTVLAADIDQDPLTFSMTDEAGIFVIGATTGTINLDEGKTLDFETTPEYIVTVGVSDGKGGTASQLITINVTDVDEVPAISDQGFDAAEDITDADEIGTVVATDPEGTALEFDIIVDDSGLFEIDNNGVLSLLAGKTLDFETDTEHMLTVEVTDGTTEPVTAEITITVTDVIETLAEDPESFVTTWTTGADMEDVAFGLDPFAGNYDFQIDWGDGTIENWSNANLQSTLLTHPYETADTYTVAIKGAFPSINMTVMGSTPDKLATIEQWGAIVWKTMNHAFEGCGNMVYNATDVPDLSNVTNLSGMFAETDAFNGDLSGWDVSTVTDMSRMFYIATAFNGDISNWDVSTVADMSYMFRAAVVFNGDLSGWDVSNVTDMGDMFKFADSFEGTGLSSWNTGSVTRMSGMFYSATNFNGDLSGWDVSNVTSMSGMLTSAVSFNAPIGDWDVSNVTDMQEMFFDASNFNRDLGGWNISSVTNMATMLTGSGLSSQNYSNTLIGWANPSAPQGISLDALGVQYCDNISTGLALTFLTNDRGWTISDGGIDVNCN
ncbi:BspA family leucine-rich repeat surface protein [Muricauda sp. CAU 1633]|uniref:BspA family leucine-rich repeat surface protein n=1 Tax=Allomuricauda sp. CAU 1633 TaxID=2816036 RepID=UPI001A8F3B39|nr:BspA family leucine-rich repeat surface protein [Muricauda sp. CAU 1633]MBO0322506.1 BspA family leucine-rich repeat surface protein [Muricauda sp. CAU 1633]